MPQILRLSDVSRMFFLPRTLPTVDRREIGYVMEWAPTSIAVERATTVGLATPKEVRKNPDADKGQPTFSEKVIGQACLPLQEGGHDVKAPSMFQAPRTSDVTHVGRLSYITRQKHVQYPDYSDTFKCWIHDHAQGRPSTPSLTQEACGLDPLFKWQAEVGGNRAPSRCLSGWSGRLEWILDGQSGSLPNVLEALRMGFECFWRG